jgi:hypothetical protein
MLNQAPNTEPIGSRGYLTLTWTLLVGLACSLGFAQESEPNEDSQNPVPGAYGAAQQSLSWMTNSLQQMAKKLDSISEKLDPNASEEEINREVKRAMREAFADFLPTASINNLGKAATDPPASSATDSLAEVDSTWPGSQSPIWDPKTPSWVKDRVVDNEVVRIAIESSVESSAQECLVAMDQQMVELVQKVLDQYVLTHTQASQIEQLTPEFF